MTQCPMPENWLPVEGYEGYYEVSDLGRVRSLPRVVEKTSRWGKVIKASLRGMILEASADNVSPYAEVRLSRNNKPWSVRVHTLVLEAFVGPCPDGQQALHGDDDKNNNTLANLRWGTPTQNKFDCVRNGHHHYAKRDSCARGHLYEGPNLVMRSDGGRRCRSCVHARARASSETERQEIADAYYREVLGM